VIESQARWKGIFKNVGFRVIIDDEEMVPEEVFDLFINAIFHSDPDNRERLKALGLIGTYADPPGVSQLGQRRYGADHRAVVDRASSVGERSRRGERWQLIAKPPRLWV